MKNRSTTVPGTHIKNHLRRTFSIYFWNYIVTIVPWFETIHTLNNIKYIRPHNVRVFNIENLYQTVLKFLQRFREVSYVLIKNFRFSP